MVDPPENVLSAVFKQAERSKGPIPVRGTLNGAKFIQTLVKYQGAWRLYINGPMLKASELSVGDTADIRIEFDPQPRKTPVPPEFARALRKNKAAKAEFEKLSPSRRKEILRYLGSLKSEDAVERNIDRLIKNLTGDRTEPRHVVMRKLAEGISKKKKNG